MLLIEPHYLPTIAFFALLQQQRKVYLNGAASYQKQTYRNRTYILGANGEQALVIPVHSSYRARTLYKDVQIAETAWRRQHWMSIKSAYGRSAYYEHYSGRIEEQLYLQHSSLYLYNIAMVKLLSHMFMLDVAFLTEPEEDLLRCEDTISPKKALPSVLTHTTSRSYPQVFADRFPFVPNMSVLDLLFNVGPQAKAYLS